MPTSGASTDRTCLKCRHWAKLVAQAGRYSNHVNQLESCRAVVGHHPPLACVDAPTFTTEVDRT